jgi:hypothetical protein
VGQNEWFGVEYEYEYENEVGASTRAASDPDGR